MWSDVVTAYPNRVKAWVNVCVYESKQRTYNNNTLSCVVVAPANHTAGQIVAGFLLADINRSQVGFFILDKQLNILCKLSRE